MRADAFLETCKAGNLSTRTTKWYETQLTTYLTWCAGRDPLSPSTARDFIHSLLSRSARYTAHPKRPQESGGLSAHTVRGYVRALRRFGNWLASEGEMNPFAALKMPKAPSAIPRGIAPEDFARMFAAAHENRDRAILLFLRETGCRAGELCNLRMSDLRIDEGYAIVRGKTGEGIVYFTHATKQAFSRSPAF